MKKIISHILSLVLIAVGIVPSFAASGKCSCGEPPIIYVAALGSGTLTLDKGTENERVLFRPDTSYVLKEFAPLVPAAAKLLATENYDEFGDVLIGCVNKVFGDLALDGSGNSSERVTSEEFHPETADHGVDTNYYFGYDFRLDPVENARKLHTYIEEVKAITGHDTVRFRSSSMGGVVTLAYIRLYGTADIETIIFQCCPLLGTAVAGELYCGKVQIDKDALIRYGEGALPALDSDFLSGTLYALIEMLDAAGVWQGLVGMADSLVLNLKDRVFEESLIPIFGTLPGIWSFVPDEYYEDAKVFMKLDESTQSGLIEKLDFYHYEVQKKAEELLKGAQSEDTTVYILAGYNMQRTPLVTAYKNTSDGTVDTMYASCGATCALLGETLPDSYIQLNEDSHNHISPDRKIDASTCMLPESTWFVKDMLHCKIHDGHKALYRKMFDSETQMTVFDDESFPQFLQNDTVNKTLTPVVAEQGELKDTVTDVTSNTTFFNIVRLFMLIFRYVISK